MRIPASTGTLLVLVAFLVLVPCILFAQGYANCELGSGPLRAEVPLPDERAKVEAIAARESAAFAARRKYRFEQDVTVDTLQDMPLGGTVIDGEYRQVSDVAFNDQGERVERVTFAPQDSLRRITLMPSDLEDIRDFTAFALTTEALPLYKVRYLGAQHVDELDTYVFEVAPVKMEKKLRYFQGKLWVETKDLNVVKTCGRSVPDVVTNKKKGAIDMHPTFATYRQQMADGNWFPVFSRADDILLFPRDAVHLRETVKFLHYEPVTSATGQWQSFQGAKKH